VGSGRLHLGVIDTALVAELSFGVEDKHMRCRECSVSDRGLLGLAVVEVGEGELLHLGAELHVLEGVTQVGIAELIEPHGERVIG
jgi:hypothetical protein